MSTLKFSCCWLLLRWGFAPLAARHGRRALAAADEGNSHKNNSTRKRKLLDPAAAVSCCGGGFATARRWPCGGGEPPTAQPPAQPPAHRWILPSSGDGFQPLPPIGDSRKKISCWNLLLLLLSPAAVGASLPLAAGHAGEESRRRPNSRTAEQPNSPNSCRRFRPLPRPPSASVRFRRHPSPAAVYHSAVL